MTMILVIIILLIKLTKERKSDLEMLDYTTELDKKQSDYDWLLTNMKWF